MRISENDCCNCSSEGYRCMGDYCLLKNSYHYYCDCCKEEQLQEELYKYEDKELCINCLLELIPKAY